MATSAFDASPVAGPGISPRVTMAAVACACVGSSAILFAVDPNRHHIYPQCPLYQATGIYCAGCGATRAVYALLHGRVLDALHDNALFMACLPVLFYVAAPHLLRAWRENAWPTFTLDQQSLIRRAIVLFLIMMAFMLLRNLPGAPFDLLRPLAA